MIDIDVWGYKIPGRFLSHEELTYLSGLPTQLPTVEWVWSEMDRVWHDIGMNNQIPLRDQAAGSFYGHPVWILNGIFTTLDPESAGHRNAIARQLDRLGAKHVADYGGGFGELAFAIRRVIQDVEVCLVEPYPSRIALARIEQDPKIRFMSSLEYERYDAVVAQDVLEHVDDPVHLAYEIVRGVKKGGVALFVNNFYPVIQCHLPSTFHLRHTFPWIMRAMGLQFVGAVEGAGNAQVFKKVGSVNLTRARRVERVSRVIGPVINVVRPLLSKFKYLVFRH